MIRKLRALLALLPPLALACGPVHHEVHITPLRPGPADAGTPADCATACDHLRELGCPEAEPTPGGATCEEVCRNAEASGTFTLNPRCIAELGSCDGLDSCTYGVE